MFFGKIPPFLSLQKKAHHHGVNKSFPENMFGRLQSWAIPRKTRDFLSRPEKKHTIHPAGTFCHAVFSVFAMVFDNQLLRSPPPWRGPALPAVKLTSIPR